ncbi:hypothetical protein PF005_g29548 [Phytophthora fragariae]|uniref:Uncharacterized protein n=2 Tax=Phytophthora TaxID=4783 RepID=A0A6A3PF56_9STRA|nr:hypothetical protein PF003_g21355 [Phytophthora fragariae]KAE9012797.1 hypothetical protein PR001_g15574 [Phytophthora rubi]KAE8899985.1 hypothetical protein PF003_g16146 [Phytophthora fragariae]KAE8963027.1 hypothetical protein PF011_g29181 [Phytophthora fragariae]KAE8963091.1 hypothetical protein PF011_g29160 [Phytophthora fragariae]
MARSLFHRAGSLAMTLACVDPCSVVQAASHVRQYSFAFAGIASSTTARLSIKT